MFHSKVISVQVIVSLFLGMACILLPLFISDSNAAPTTSEIRPRPTPSATPTVTPQHQKDSDSGSVSDPELVLVALRG